MGGGGDGASLPPRAHTQPGRTPLHVSPPPPTHPPPSPPSLHAPDLRKLLALAPLLVAVSGRVFAERPLRCELSDKAAAIVEAREERRSERRAAAMWVPEAEVLRQSVRECEWGLEDGSGAALPVERGAEAAGDFMSVSGDLWTPERTATMGQLVAGLTGHKTLGTLHAERALEVGTALTAVGELAGVLDKPGAFKVGGGLAGGWMGGWRRAGGGGEQGGAGSACCGRGANSGGARVAAARPC